MANRCLLCYITDRTAFALDEPTRRKRLLDKIAEAANADVDYIQLREKDLPSRELESLAREAVKIIGETKRLTSSRCPSATALLINSRTDVALAVGADGVHLRSDDISPQQVRKIWTTSHVGTAALGRPAVRSTAAAGVASVSPDVLVIGVSCHSPEEVQTAAVAAATFAVFAPVFEKKDSLGTTAAGLAQLEQACRTSIPVLALGGINLENAEACLKAGATGIAAIRLFQENEIASIVRRLRG